MWNDEYQSFVSHDGPEWHVLTCTLWNNPCILFYLRSFFFQMGQLNKYNREVVTSSSPMRNLLHNDITSVPASIPRRRKVTIFNEHLVENTRKTCFIRSQFSLVTLLSASIFLTNQRARRAALHYRVAGQRTQNQHQRRVRSNLDYAIKQVSRICSSSTGCCLKET